MFHVYFSAQTVYKVTNIFHTSCITLKVLLRGPPWETALSVAYHLPASVCLSVHQSVPCLRFTRNQKAL